MEVEFEEELEIGDVKIDCPFCNGEGYYYVRSKNFGKDVAYIERDCPLCKGAGIIGVYVGEVTVSGTTEVDMSDYAPDHSWRD